MGSKGFSSANLLLQVLSESNASLDVGGGVLDAAAVTVNLSLLPLDLHLLYHEQADIL